MMAPLEFSYAQARVQARLATLPSEPEWERLSGARGLGSYLEEARIGPLGPWLKAFSALSGPHDLERGIRTLAWEQAREAAAWMPRGWRPAVEWVAWLPYLAAFEELARNRRLPPWARQDPRLRGLLEDAEPAPLPDPDRAGLRTLISAGDPSQVAFRWIQEWQGRWPRARRATTRPLEVFGRELRGHVAAFRQAGPDAAWGLRRQLRDRLRLRLHQRLLQPLTVFLYLALVLLELERLRGELVGRSLFAPGALGLGMAPEPARC